MWQGFPWDLSSNIRLIEMDSKLVSSFRKIRILSKQEMDYFLFCNFIMAVVPEVSHQLVNN